MTMRRTGDVRCRGVSRIMSGYPRIYVSRDKGVGRGWDFRIYLAGRALFQRAGLDMSSAPCAGGSGDVPAAGPGEPPAAPSALHGMDSR